MLSGYSGAAGWQWSNQSKSRNDQNGWGCQVSQGSGRLWALLPRTLPTRRASRYPKRCPSAVCIKLFSREHISGEWQLHGAPPAGADHSCQWFRRRPRGTRWKWVNTLLRDQWAARKSGFNGSWLNGNQQNGADRNILNKLFGLTDATGQPSVKPP